MKQLGLFTPPERKRLSRQCEAILLRLRAGPATNAELAQIALKYTSRISDLRKAGYDVRVTRRERKSGVTVYEMAQDDVAAPTRPT